MQDRLSRRGYLRFAGIAAATTAVAGCSSASGDGGSDGSSGDGGSDGSGGDGEDGSDGGSGEWVEASTVDMTDELTFEPEKIQVSAGTEVTWETVGSVGHTVTAYEDEIPDGADYFASGGFDSEQAAKDGYGDGNGGNVPEGESYSHTFETTGTYEYYCIPHEMNGMVGSVKVV